MLVIGDKIYTFDIDRIMKFVNYSDKNPSKETELLDSYEKGELLSKTVRELTTPGNTQIDNISYDLIKMFIGQIITYDNMVEDLRELPFGMKLAVNTLLNYKMLIEINAD